jgi:pathogenesis-related protein 1
MDTQATPRSAANFAHRVVPILTLLFAVAASAAETVPAAPMLAAHNKVRSRHGVPPLSWSKSLARDAGVWADHLAKDSGCAMHHTTSAGEGENLYWASAATWSDGRRDVQPVTPERVVKSWASEEADYNYARNSCRAGKACGHYTQIVWKDSTRVGCAKRTCSDKSQIWVCRYSPPGNWVGSKPY